MVGGPEEVVQKWDLRSHLKSRKSAAINSEQGRASGGNKEEPVLSSSLNYWDTK